MSTSLAATPNAYRQSAILTAPPERLVVMLYDGAIRFLHQAAAAVRGQDIAAAHGKLRRAEDIVAHLNATLDHERGGEIAAQLQAIYLFCRRQLNEARVSRDAEKIEVVIGLLAQLRDSWAAVCPE